MLPEQRIVTKIPLTELWDQHGPRSALRVRHLDATALTELVRTTALEFVVANSGDKLKWIPFADRFEFWKVAKTNLADPEKPIILDQFSNNFAYIASEWRGRNNECIVLLETRH